jgi:hypothetical protein
MEEIKVKKIDAKRFNALAGQSRSPVAAYVSKELAWYSNTEETVIGVILLDIIDNDYAAIILGRDEGGGFRAFDVETCLQAEKEATDWLIRMIKWHTGKEKKIFPQGDAKKRIDLFSPIVPIEKQHPYFIRLNRDSGFSPAKAIINEMMSHFIDIDGNFVEQFQSTGFDSRLWELYLNSYFSEEQLFINREHSAPEFIGEKFGKKVAVEAVIVGRKSNNPPRYFREQGDIKIPNNILKEHENSMPIKFGSPLYSKLKKKYWELPHVSGIPLVFAIADFHDDQSMLWSSTALISYLYGVKHNFHYNAKNQLIITPLKIKAHKTGKKEIPSGYFFQPDSEHVSAVLFSASGTISKFNRMGKQAGFGDPKVIMIREGACHDHNPNAAVPKFFRYMVDEKSNETWREGLSMFHNPNALHPVPKELFPSIAHHYFRQDGQIVSHLPRFHPYHSVTYIIKTKK